MEQLKAFWTYISTPGAQMPVKDTLIFFVFVFAFIVIMPQFVQWLAYRKQNPLHGPGSKNNAASGTNAKKNSNQNRNQTKNTSQYKAQNKNRNNNQKKR